MSGSDKTQAKSSRILLIAPEPFYAERGTPMNVLQMCRALTKGGYSVDLVTYPMGNPVSLPGLTIHRAWRIPGIKSVPIGFSKRKVLQDVSLCLKILFLYLRNRYQVIHAVEESVFLALPFTWLGARLVYDLDSLISDQLQYSEVLGPGFLLKGVRRMERLALSRSCAAISVCQSLTDAAKEYSPLTPIFQIEDAPLAEFLRAPDPGRVEQLRSEFDLNGRPVLVYTGNLESYQGIDLLVDAIPILRQKFSNVALAIVGGDRARCDSLRAHLESSGLADNIIVVGRRPSSEMPEWLALADLLVSPRKQGDNTPLKLFSYMHSGSPIVATNLLTHTQVLDSSTAFLCEPTPEAFAEALELALGNPTLAETISRDALARAEDQYSLEAFERKMLDAYARIVAGEIPSDSNPGTVIDARPGPPRTASTLGSRVDEGP